VHRMRDRRTAESLTQTGIRCMRCKETVSRRRTLMISFLQINLNRCWAAEQLMMQTANEIGADLLIVSEPATQYGNNERWCFSKDHKAAIGT